MCWITRAFLWGFFVTLSAGTWAAENEQDCKQFADHLRWRMVAIIHDDQRKYEQKHLALVSLFTEAFDMQAVAHYAAGNYWDQATKTERADYFKAYSAYLPNFYIGSFNEEDLNGIIDVTISDFKETSPQHYTAHTRIMQKYDDPIQAEFQIIKTSVGGCLIHDFTTEGVSMMNMQREEMQSLGQEGGLPNITQKLAARAR